MALSLPVAVPSSTAFKRRLGLVHNARVADEGSGRVVGDASALLIGDTGTTGSTPQANRLGWPKSQAASWSSSDCQLMHSTGARGVVLGYLVGLVVGFLDS